MTTHKGIYYFPSVSQALEFSQSKRIQARIVAYERGYALQFHKSGPYVGSKVLTHETCAFCPMREISTGVL